MCIVWDTHVLTGHENCYSGGRSRDRCCDRKSSIDRYLVLDDFVEVGAGILLLDLFLEPPKGGEPRHVNI